MFMFFNIFSLFATAVSIYTVLCIVRIFLTWIPDAERSAVGRFFSRLCDPYLNLFRKLKFLRFGALDISPIVAMSVLWAASAVLNALGMGQTLTFAKILEVLVELVWQIVSSVLWILLIFFIVRLVVLLFSKSTYGTIWDSIDRSFSPLLFRITAPFYRGRAISFKGSLIIAILEIIVLEVAGGWVIGFLITLIRQIPL